MIPVFVGSCEKGKVKVDLHEAFERYLISLEGKRVTIEVKQFRKKRSLPQNSFYWGVCVEVLSKHFGYENEEMHMVLREKFLRIHDDKHPDFVIAKSTAGLTTLEFVEYIDKIMRWAAVEHQIYIPAPEE